MKHVYGICLKKTNQSLQITVDWPNWKILHVSLKKYLKNEFEFLSIIFSGEKKDYLNASRVKL